ncbi:MAG: hypothetical protein JWM07_518 [Candidatus Saccharibacteria bacterium]|nr:hypothetical protein [Candidatus Saccharibacteria bacterium]
MQKVNDSCMVTTKRRETFSDALKDLEVTSKSHLTGDVQVKLFNQFPKWEDRCALRRFLTDEYALCVETGGILSDQELAKANQKVQAERAKAASQTEGVLV